MVGPVRSWRALRRPGRIFTGLSNIDRRTERRAGRELRRVVIHGEAWTGCVMNAVMMCAAGGSGAIHMIGVGYAIEMETAVNR